MANYRSGRINEELKKEISNIIRNDIKDPRVSGMVSVTNVTATKDLRYAKVMLSIFGTEKQKEETLDALKNSSGFIRREVGHRIKLRYTPELIIELDNSIEQGMHINSIIQKIKESDDESEQNS
ncbi:30S ribosome-binding factor RbfA [Clostridium polynesiense]|uniref:30S ribosome-binding factor RbfA n=1 Tax=Clostridium polynesiense TaxID=1325933 RepID=UPI00058B3151|nr:30S ribosome-binding factor RbfA [Clostridium polynesiense]